MTKAGWIISALLALFLLAASVAPKFLGAEAAVDSLEALGWSPRHLLLIGAIELAGVILFLVPRTALLGAVLLTGLLGGALASHLRAESPLFTRTLFSVYLGLFIWAALWLRDERLRALLPLRSA